MRAKTSILLALILVAAPVAGQAGEIYSWTDQDGVVHLTNKPRKTARQPRAAPAQPQKREVVASASAAPRLTSPRDPKFEEHIEEAAAYYKVPVELVKAIIAAESNYDPIALSHAGAMGLMQLIPGTADEMYVNDPYDPRQNIHGGVRYLRYLANMFNGDLVKVIAAYNAGPDKVIKARGVPRIAETQTYVKRVLKFYYAYKGR